MTEKRKFEPESELLTNSEETNGEESAQYPTNGKGLYFLLALFIILFLTSVSFFVYYQFYQGNGKWSFSLKKYNFDKLLLDSLMKENSYLKHEIDSMSANLTGQIAKDSVTGMFPGDLNGEKYEVQIGYFRNFDFTKYAPFLINMNIDSSGNSVKLLIGRFDNVEDACRFRKDIVNLGIKNAFIVKKIDGKRVEFDKPCP